MKNWWKFLSVALLLWSFVAGLLVPLKPGIFEASPTSFQAGKEAQIDIIGYNSFFQKQGADLRVWLKKDSAEAILAKNAEPTAENRLRATFDLPPHFPGKNLTESFTLIVDSKTDGPMILPNAATITQDSVSSKSDEIWKSQTVSNLSFRKDFTYPYRNILAETIRNTFFHVPLWFAMMILFVASVVLSIKHLKSRNPRHDQQAFALTEIGTLFGILGLVTGAIWAKNTWGQYWSFDVKQNTSAVCVLIYMAYFVLRSSFDDEEKRGRISAVYNIFAFATLIPLLFIIPRMYASLHPGNGGNPALGSDDLDSTMRLVFYPAIIGMTLLGVWIAQIRARMLRIEEKINEN